MSDTLKSNTAEPNPDTLTATAEDAARPVIGHVIAPKGYEATLDSFYFWANPESWVEKTQIVLVECAYEDGKRAKFYGVVDEASYVDKSASVHDDRDRRSVPGGRGGPIDNEGTAFFKVDILATDPDIYIPPVSGACVYPATHAEAAYAYGFDKIKLGAPVGLLKNGAKSHAGPALIDLGYLLGENGGHLNINGISGVATKTSSMLVAMMSLLQTAERLRRERPAAPGALRIIPVLFSVKGTDMLWLDKPSRPFAEIPARAQHWRDMGLEPRPFRNVSYMVPARSDHPLQPRPVVARADLMAYSWGLADIVEGGLFRYLFAAEDVNQNWGFLLNQWEKRLTLWQDGRRSLKPREMGLGYNPDGGGTPQTFKDLVDFIESELNEGEARGDDQRSSSRMDYAHVATVQKLYRRLKGLEYGNGGVLAWRDSRGRPPVIGVDADTEAHVIDIASLASSPDIQRFVIAAVLDALKEERTRPDAAHGVRYLVGLDELNQWAPRGSSDATTRLFERIASEMRSLGLILFGAQQFASQVSAKIPENSSCRMYGRTGPGELSDDLYKDLTSANKRMVTRLQPGEQILTVPSFRVPAHMDVPFPAWAMRFEEVAESGGLVNTGVDDEGPMFRYSGIDSDEVGA